ncbi:MAG: UDP-N-acetylmuramoyl-L-alanine--D-glutamate ligase [Solirubrobacterales bacterium]
MVGLARSGLAAARLIAGRGETVFGVDSGHPPGAEGLGDLGVEVSLDGQGLEHLGAARTVVKSPGVPREAPVIEAARERGIEVIGELELAWRALAGRFVAVTGTNGKTTTAELIGHLYRTAGEPVAVAGNVGTPLSSLAGEHDPGVTVVCECSSFQLEDTTAFAPECAVFLNLAPDHLDRHASMEQYLEAKLAIFSRQSGDDVAVFNADEPMLEGRDLGGAARRVAFCPEPGHEGECEVRLEGETIVAGGEPLIESADLGIAGPHNRADAMAAAAAALSMGLPREAVRDGLASFRGLAHRMEVVAEIGGVAYVNDSKATNVGATVAALEATEGPVRAILGGSLKEEDYAPLAGPVALSCAACYLIGEASGRIEAALRPAAAEGVEVFSCGTLEEAVRRAAADAREGETVLLSPACASFDAFADFEERGERFRELVGRLA